MAGFGVSCRSYLSPKRRMWVVRRQYFDLRPKSSIVKQVPHHHPVCCRSGADAL